MRKYISSSLLVWYSNVTLDASLTVCMTHTRAQKDTL